MHWVGAPGTSVAEMERTTTRGQPGAPRHPRSAQLRRAHRPGAARRGGRRRQLRRELDQHRPVRRLRRDARRRSRRSRSGYPGLFRDVQTYLDERIEEVLTGGKEPIVVRVYGEDLACCERRPQEILSSAGAASTASSDAHVDSRRTCRRSRSRSTWPRPSEYGLKPGDVRRAAATLVAGEEVGDIFRAGKRLRRRGVEHPGDAHERDAIGNLPIDTPSGARVRLTDVATVALKPNPNAIERQNDSRRIDVGAERRGPRPRLGRARAEREARAR